MSDRTSLELGEHAGVEDEELQDATGQVPGGRRRSRASILVIVIVLLVAAGGALAYAYWAGWIGDASDAAQTEITGDAQIVFSGRAEELKVPAGNIVQPEASDPPLVWIRSSLAVANPEGATDGVSVALDSKLTDRWLGRLVRVTVSAAVAADQSNPPPFAVAYSTNGSGNSGWRVFSPTTTFADYSFVYRIPPGTAGARHYVGIWSDITGRNSPLAVRRISIEALR